ncbi:PAS domain-containing sensor histidine kinase [Natronomonas marina]|uniref:PAS domain-containing sensor histidine kinase n=1 Tax=Natronomonas marina TaxID=2961939 RepID=UPI0020C9F118|nr:HAMP domain-containing sensor histidine kinase [Natronomonas marina]
MARLSGPSSGPAATAVVSSVGVVLSWWHATVLVGSMGAPAVALLGTVVLLVVSLLLIVAGGWLSLGSVAPETAVRTGGWVLLMTAAFGTIGVLVSLHLDFVLAGFDGGPLVADLVTVGAAVGFLVGQYDARGRRYRAAMNEERDRFASLFDNLPNPAAHYRLEGDSAVVLDTNGAFAEVFGVDEATARGRSLGALVAPGGAASEAGRRSHDPPDGAAATSEAQRVTANGLRDFQVITVPYDGSEGFSIWIDVTDRKLQLRRLEVLNRVLRHDLRTDAAIISGHADLLSDSPEAETIRERALAMAERGSTARRVEDALGDSTERRSLDLATVVERELADLDGATVEADLREATVRGSNALGMAIDELLENAVEHNDAADPMVRVTIADDAGDRDAGGRFVTLEIADDGPGLPEMEREVFETNSETPLQHSSGLGLWLARWVVADLGGEITIDDREPQGTVVRLRLPRAESATFTAVESA